MPELSAPGASGTRAEDAVPGKGQDWKFREVLRKSYPNLERMGMFMLVKGLEKRSFASPRKGAIQAIFVSVAIVLSAVPALALIDPWINEVDYDQPGTDTNEWIELAGPAGVSLDDFEILLINQVGSVYNTVDLADAEYTFRNEVNGVGFFMLGIVSPVFSAIADFTPAGWDSNEIQNGPTDSIQLRRKGGANVHLIDYDGQNPNTVEDQFTNRSDNNTDPITTIFLGGKLGGPPGPGLGTKFADFEWDDSANQGTPGGKNFNQGIAEADLLLTDLQNFPEQPLDTDPVHIQVVATPTNCAGNAVLTAMYRIGSTGTFQSAQMSLISGNTYRTDSPIPAQPSRSQIDYYVEGTFSGAGSNSPRVLPADAPSTVATDLVQNIFLGKIWINELNYNGGAFDLDTETNEYIEVTGPSGFDMGDWSIELVDVSSAVYAAYRFGSSFALPESGTNGFGFFVLGDTGVPNVDTVFTNSLVGSPSTSMGKRGAIRLLDELGQIVDEVSYGFPAPTGSFPDAVYAGEDSVFVIDDESLGLVGTGSVRTGFVWAVNTTLTPGAENQNQTLIEPPPELPTLEIISIVQTGNNVTIRSTGVPESWTIIPEYWTNPMGSEGVWQMVNPSVTSYDGGTNTTTFTSPIPSAISILYRVRASELPVILTPNIVEISQNAGTDFEIKSMGNEGRNVIVEYTTDPPAGEPNWIVVPGIGNSFLAGINTTTFANPAPGSGLMHFRVRQTAP